MAGPGEPVSPGDPLVIFSTDFNGWQKAAALAKVDGLTVLPGPGGSASALTIRIKNDSSVIVQRYGALGISGFATNPIIDGDPIILTGRSPVAADVGNFVVCAEPIEPGQIGRAYVNGVFLATVNITDVDDIWADITPNTSNAMINSSSNGEAAILWYQGSGTGSHMAALRLGNQGGGGQWLTINSHTGTGMAWLYNATLDSGGTVSAFNRGFEPCTGTPGPLGVNVGGSGSVNSGTCIVQPIGNNARVWGTPWTGNAYQFSAPNSAQ